LSKTDCLTLIELPNRQVPRGLARDFSYVPLHEERKAKLKDATEEQNDNRQNEGEFDCRDAIALMPKRRRSWPPAIGLDSCYLVTGPAGGAGS
jgi:hypothetical protein